MSLGSLLRSVTGTFARFVAPTALVLAAAVAVFLAQQNRDLLRDVKRLRGQQRLPHLHDVMPVVRAPRLDGGTAMLGGGPDQAQVLFMFDVGCHYCAENLAKWQMIYRAMQGAPRVGVYAVSLDSDSATRAYVEAHKLTMPVARFPDHRSAGTYRIIGVPVTLVVDSSGLVLYERASVLTMPAVDSLFDVLRQVKLVPTAAPAAAPNP